jgi:hypothetical protein
MSTETDLLKRDSDRYDPLKELQDIFSAPAVSTNNSNLPVYAAYNEFGSFTDESQTIIPSMPLSQSNPAINTILKPRATSFDDFLNDINKVSLNPSVQMKPTLQPTSNNSSSIRFDFKIRRNLKKFFFQQIIV